MHAATLPSLTMRDCSDAPVSATPSARKNLIVCWARLKKEKFKLNQKQKLWHCTAMPAYKEPVAGGIRCDYSKLWQPRIHDFPRFVIPNGRMSTVPRF